MDVSQQYLLQNIFKAYHAALVRTRMPIHHSKAVDNITDCRSGQLGTSYYQCSEEHAVHEQHHSCRHRSCYMCSLNSRRVWIDAQKKRLIDCPHFHVVFTLPQEYRVLWQYNTEWFTRVLFASVQETLLTLMKDEKHHGVTPGLLLTLHSWGRQLNVHPHIHCLITAGGLNKDNEWQSCGDYLLPSKVMRALYKGKIQARIREALFAGTLHFPSDKDKSDCWRAYKSANKKQWNVSVQEQYKHGEGVLLYLSRYMKGGPINPAQITECTNKRISFRYKDHRDSRIKLKSLPPMAFVKQLLKHVPSTGVHTVRHYGLYGSAGKKKRNIVRELLGDLTKLELANSSVEKDMVMLCCGTCGKAMTLSYRSGRKRFKKGNSLIEYRANRVQQGDESDHANEGISKEPSYSTG